MNGNRQQAGRGRQGDRQEGRERGSNASNPNTGERTPRHLKAVRQAIDETRPAQGGDDDRALFERYAEEKARKLAGIPTSQLYGFFDAVQAIRQRLEQDSSLGAPFIRQELALLKAKAAYRILRQNYTKEPVALVELLGEYANSIQDRQDFMRFLRHFEAIMAYHYVHAEDRNQ